MKREMKRVKKFGVILVLNKSEERSEKSGFCSYRCFWESEKLMSKKFKRAKFFVHVRLLKAVSLQLLMAMRFDSDIVLV